MDYERKSTFKYALCRIAEMILILLILSMIVFALSRLCPGDPLRSWYGDGVDRMS
ncbi:MAG: ABC transporter permease, partial [Mogibacterium diversum]|nr:ABC transporter permease [Mogibacterium diversum]